MSIDARWWGRASGSVTAMTIRKSAIEPLDENHLWPSITYSSPSRTARVRSSVGSEPAVSGSVIENAERRSPASSGCSQRSFCSGVPASARISLLPESGAWLPKALGANGEVPRISCIRPSLTWPKPCPPSSGGEVRRPQPARPDLGLQRRVDAIEVVLGELADERLERPDLLAHEGAHPVELGLELRFGRELPCHRAYLRAVGTPRLSRVRAGQPPVMRVVVTGATGNAGSALVRRLAAEPRVDEIVGIARRLPAWSIEKTSWRVADVSRDRLEPLLDGADAVVHLAWLIQPSRDEATTWATNVEGSRRVFAAVAAARVRRAGLRLLGRRVRARPEGSPGRRVAIR